MANRWYTGNPGKIAERRIQECREHGVLNLAHLELTDIPESMRELTMLTRLDISYNALSALPDWIGEFSELENLDVGANQLTTLPATLGNLKALRNLELGGNRLIALPESIGNLASLAHLYACQNELTNIPESIGRLASLQELHLDMNQLTSLPESIGKLGALRELRLPTNKLARLPTSMVMLKELDTLRLHSNQLTEIPEWLKHLTKLRMLELASNRLEGGIPDWIGDLWRISLLDLSGNRLATIPKRIGDLRPDCEVDLWGNQLIEPPQKIAEAGLQSIKEYFRLRDERIAQESRVRWVSRSSLASLHLGLKSRLAVLETLCCSGALLILLATGYNWPLYGIAAVPLLLLRTSDSVACGTRRLARLIGYLQIRSGKLEGRPLLLTGALLVLGIGSVLIKVITTLQFAIRWNSILGIPNNYENQLTKIDSFSPPELVPGTEEAFSQNRVGVLTASELLTNFVADIRYQSAVPLYRFNPFISLVGLLCLGGFFLAAWAYRFSLKATCLFYWPFLLVHRYQSDEQIAEEAKSRKQPTDWLKQAPVSGFMVLIGGVALMMLLRREGLKEQASIVEKFIPEKIAAIFHDVDPLVPPKIVFTSVLFTTVFYLIGVVAMGGMAWVHAVGAGLDRSDHRMWRGVFKFSATAQNLCICVTTAYIFVWAWPLALKHAADVWRLLF